MEFEQIKYELEDGIATITLNRPDKRNAITRQLAKEIREGINLAKNDIEVKVLILTAAGTVFCGGVDLAERSRGEGVTMPPKGAVLQNWAGGFEWALRRFYKPTIAAMNGPAIGMGCDLALMCDFRVATEKASFSEAYVRLGQIPSAGVWLLPRMVGMAVANKILLLGHPFSAQQAHEWELVYKIVPDDELISETKILAKELANLSPVAVQFLKNGIWTGLSADLEQTLEYITYSRTASELSEDYFEGGKAFVEKREPNFTGHRRPELTP